MDWLREKVASAARDPGSDWMVEDVLTLTSLWREIFEEGRSPTHQQMLSINW